MISDQCNWRAEGSHDCTGTGTDGVNVLYCHCWCHNVKRGFLWGAIANLFGAPGPG